MGTRASSNNDNEWMNEWMNDVNEWMNEWMTPTQQFSALIIQI
jgi:hypothetical protein